MKFNMKKHPSPVTQPVSPKRRGATLVLFLVTLMITMGMIAFGIDIGRITWERTKMQNAVDSAVLAAAQEVVIVIQGNGGDNDGTGQARSMAMKVAEANGVFVNAGLDVTFGNRSYDEQAKTWSVEWGAKPYNSIKVVARRDNDSDGAPDKKLPLLFGWALGQEKATIRVEATAFIEARDIVAVLDFSGSMNYDSRLFHAGSIGQSAITANQKDIYEALGSPGNLPFTPENFIQTKTINGKSVTVSWRRSGAWAHCPNGIKNAIIKYEDDTVKVYNNINTYNWKWLETSGDIPKYVWVMPIGESQYHWAFGGTPSYIINYYGLNNITWPYHSGDWEEFIEYCRGREFKYGAYNKIYTSLYSLDDFGFDYKYGGQSLVEFLLHKKDRHYKCQDLWKTPHYPFHANKGGMTYFCKALDDLGFGDHLGLVSYGETARWETTNTIEVSVDISQQPITSNVMLIDTIQRHRQAAHYSSATAMGDGIKKAREMLTQHHREGAQLSMLVMTDGNTNQIPSGWSPPSGWDISETFDLDGYYAGTLQKYALWEAYQAMQEDITIHTISAGAGADHTLMKIIAEASGGVHVAVGASGSYTPEELEAQFKYAYEKIASAIPTPRLISGN